MHFNCIYNAAIAPHAWHFNLVTLNYAYFRYAYRICQVSVLV